MPLLGLFDAKLLAAIVLISLPFAAAVAVRIFGSLREFWSAERSTWRTPGEVVEDVAKDIFVPRALRRRRPFFGDERIPFFWLCYIVTILAAYSIVHEHFPGLARVLSGW